MPLTPTQLTALKAHIAADPTLSALPNSTDGHIAVAALLNLTADPAFVVWRTGVSVDEMMSNGFDWTRVDNATVGKARIWEWMMSRGVINPSKPNIRAGIDEAWSGTGAEQVAHRAGIYAHCKRAATRAERLFAAGTGTAQSPGTMGFEGAVTPAEVETARNLPA